jgi:aspartyl protease family protein
MPTGRMRYFISLSLLAGACLGLARANAGEVALIGVIGDKAAVLAIDGGDPKTVKVGQKWSGVSVLSVEKDRATVEIDGRKRVLQQGQHYRAAVAASDHQSVTLAANGAGHFFSEGSINGVPIRFLVDTGASSIALSGAEAQRMGLDYRKGRRGVVQTANGPAVAYNVRLDTVRVGSIELAGVDAVIIEQGLNVALLGMTFLNRVEMRRDGEMMTLIRRF